MTLLTILICHAILIFHGQERGKSAPEKKLAPREVRRYAIVVEEKTLQEPGWKEVVKALEKKRSAQVFKCQVFKWEPGGVDGLRSQLGPWRPHYVCFVARPEELARETKAQIQGSDGAAHEVPLCGGYYHDL
ncbi:MAG: hypothetical protein HY717_09955 [Planctomycetes bacterium]|nr:hypothetical protein [Planctomycetota bacterium]